MKVLILLALLLSSQVWAKWSVSTYNIRNFDNDPGAGKTNLVELEKIIKTVSSDVMAFEEVVNMQAFKSLIKKIFPTYTIALSDCGGYGKQHIGIIFNPKVFEFVEQTEDLSFTGSANACGSLRPVFLVTLQNIASGKNFTFGGVHLKAGGDQRAFNQRWNQYELLTKLAKKYSTKNLILLGDFNSTGYILKDDDYQHFEDFMSGAKLRTMTESLGCTNYWHGDAGGPEFQASILDHIIIQDKYAASVQSVKVGSHCAKTDCRAATPQDLGVSYESVSDHCPVQVSFQE